MSSPLVQFYAGKTVLVTGGTGFMGRILVEKLLRSCPDIGRIYLIVRPKKGLSVEQRMQKYFEDIVFSLINENKSLLSKVYGFEGDIMQDNLGLSSEDRLTLEKNVNIIFHMAASINLHQTLDIVAPNVLVGTYNVLQLAKNITNLAAFIHVSTAYVGVLKDHLDESIYEAPISPDELLRLHFAGELKEKGDSLLGNWTCAYTYTKAVSEVMVKESKIPNVPFAIFRPALVSSCAEEPLPGWMDNYNGSTGIVYAVSSGMCHVLRFNPDAKAQVVPCDMVINALIACGWETGVQRPKEIKVYNYTADLNKIHLKETIDKVLFKYSKKYPFEFATFYPCYFSTNVSFETYLKMLFIFHTIPAHIIDQFMKITGGKATYVKKVTTMNTFLAHSSFAMLIDTTFGYKNVLSMWQNLSPKDQNDFPFNMKYLNWDTYLENFTKGMKMYLLKENMDNLEKVKAKRFRYMIIHYFLTLVCIPALVGLLLYYCFAI